MNAICSIARKELQDGLRNRWMLAISLLFVVLAVGIAWFGAAASGQVGFSSIDATVASLTSLATFLIPLIALLLAYDAIVGEDEGGTLLLLLTYPLSRGQLLLGKFLGQGLILALATILGFGAAAVAIAAMVSDLNLTVLFVAFSRFIVSSILLGWAFMALAYLLSAQAREKSSAAGMALGVWFWFVLVFDLLLLALLVASKGQFSPQLLPWLLLLNPTDIYRQINLNGLNAGNEMTGLLALGQSLPADTLVLWSVLGLWVILLLALAYHRFARGPI